MRREKKNPDTDGKRGKEMERRDSERQRISFSDERKRGVRREEGKPNEWQVRQTNDVKSSYNGYRRRRRGDRLCASMNFPPFSLFLSPFVQMKHQCITNLAENELRCYSNSIWTMYNTCGSISELWCWTLFDLRNKQRKCLLPICFSKAVVEYLEEYLKETLQSDKNLKTSFTVFESNCMFFEKKSKFFLQLPFKLYHKLSENNIKITTNIFRFILFFLIALSFYGSKKYKLTFEFVSAHVSVRKVTSLLRQQRFN